MAKIGWIGLGNIGNPMSKNLLKAGHEVTVWNRTKLKVEDVLAAGAEWADTPKEQAEKCDFIFTMVSDGPALQAVTLGEIGVAAGLHTEKIIIDMSTVAPEESAKIHEAIEAKDGKFIRGAVIGNGNLAQNSALGILASGDRRTYYKVLPLFEVMGNSQFYVGGAEEARVLKLALNVMIGVTSQMIAEAVVLGEKAGLDVAQICEILAGSVVGSPLMGFQAALVSSGDYKSAYSVNQMMKDFDLAFAAANQYNVAMPVTAVTRQCLQSAAASGRGEKDFAVLTEVLEEQCYYKRGKGNLESWQGVV